jgi:hypothetical protein
MTDAPPPSAPPPPPPPPSAPPPAPQTGVVVRPKIFFFAFFLLLFKVRLSVDAGLETTIAWGENFIPLSPGRHTLRCWLPYLIYRHMGNSSVEVDVPAGGVVRAQWRTPWLVFLQGTWKVTPA